jgi:hypothetical protein
MAKSALLIVAALVVQPLVVVAQRPAPPLLSTVASPPAGMDNVPADMSGQPLQVGDLPPGVVVVRVIRRRFADNVAQARVQLRVGNEGRVAESVTDGFGRAEFDGLRVGENVRATTAVDGEVIGSQMFTLPAEGGVRVLLAAGVGAGIPGNLEPAVPAGGQSPAVRGESPSLPSVTPATVAITLFAVAAAAILWPLWPRRRAPIDGS